MGRHIYKAMGLTALALVSAAVAVPTPDAVYTFCETEDNDLCVDAQILDAGVAVMSTGEELVRDCFYLTGKLQEDCVWDFQPKCAIRAYGKPLQCYDSNRVAIPGQFYEPLLASSDSQGRILNLAPGVGDRTIRLAVGATLDALDGTVNGLNQNSAHNETGEVTIKLVYDGIDDGPFRGESNVDYVWRFLNGSDALRVAFVIPGGVSTVDVYCCNDTGTQEVCYDVDFYHVTNLIPNRSYCVTVVGGLDEDCFKTDLILGWFDKQWQQLPGTATGDGASLPELCILSDGEGEVRFGVSGYGDANFNGLYDSDESDYFFFRFLLDINGILDDTYRMGASTKDASADSVVRYPRSVWDNELYTRYFDWARIAPEVVFSHDVCGEYCIKVRLAEHVDPSERPEFGQVMGPQMADLNLDETVNASDLAMLLSFWGPVPAQ